MTDQKDRSTAAPATNVRPKNARRFISYLAALPSQPHRRVRSAYTQSCHPRRRRHLMSKTSTGEGGSGVTGRRISALSGQSRPNWAVSATSAFHLTATELRTSLDVLDVPEAEVQPPHSITSVARASRAGDGVRPSALAVLRFGDFGSCGLFAGDVGEPVQITDNPFR